MSQIKVVDLFTYPIKGTSANPVAMCPVEATGLQGDRRFMVVDPDGKFITQRECPKLATVTARYEMLHGTQHLLIAAAGWEERADGSRGAVAVLSGPHFKRSNTSIGVRIWGEIVPAFPCDNEGVSGVDEALSLVLDRPARLVWMPESAGRPSRDQLDDVTVPVLNSFADGYPFLLTSVESLRDLNYRLREAGQPYVTMDRFRPNIVVEGCEEAFDEEDWREFRIGNVTFYGMKRCGRCVVTTTDQVTGDRMGKEPLRTLNEYRRFGREACFGMNLNHANNGVIRVGDVVEVVRRGSPYIPNRHLSI